MAHILGPQPTWPCLINGFERGHMLHPVQHVALMPKHVTVYCYILFLLLWGWFLQHFFDIRYTWLQLWSTCLLMRNLIGATQQFIQHILIYIYIFNVSWDKNDKNMCQASKSFTGWCLSLDLQLLTIDPHDIISFFGDTFFKGNTSAV